MQHKTVRFLSLILLTSMALIEALPDVPQQYDELTPQQSLFKRAVKSLSPKRRHSAPEAPTAKAVRFVITAKDMSTDVFHESDYMMLDDLKKQPSPYGWTEYKSPYAYTPSEVSPTSHAEDVSERVRHALNMIVQGLDVGDNVQKMIESARELMQKGAHSDECDEERGNTLLHIAAQMGDKELTDWLLKEQGAHPYVENKSGRTPLHVATLFGHTATITALLQDPDVDLNATEQAGNTPLHFAAQRNSKELVKLLRKYGARQDITNRAGKSAAQLCPDTEIYAGAHCAQKV